jgi:hypothetical protein
VRLWVHLVSGVGFSVIDMNTSASHLSETSSPAVRITAAALSVSVAAGALLMATAATSSAAATTSTAASTGVAAGVQQRAARLGNLGIYAKRVEGNQLWVQARGKSKRVIFKWKLSGDRKLHKRNVRNTGGRTVLVLPENTRLVGVRAKTRKAKSVWNTIKNVHEYETDDPFGPSVPPPAYDPETSIHPWLFESGAPLTQEQAQTIRVDLQKRLTRYRSQARTCPAAKSEPERFYPAKATSFQQKYATQADAALYRYMDQDDVGWFHSTAKIDPGPGNFIATLGVGWNSFGDSVFEVWDNCHKAMRADSFVIAVGRKPIEGKYIRGQFVTKYYAIGTYGQ